MVFEFDSKKSAANFKKHGIDFEEAQELWLDYQGLEMSARTIGEQRKILIAQIKDEIWSAIYTYRNKTIRIISVRKSRKNEKEIYYNRGI